MSFDSIPCSFWDSIKLRIVAINQQATSKLTIWVLISSLVSNFSILDLDVQHVTLEVSMGGQLHAFTLFMLMFLMLRVIFYGSIW